MRALRWILWGVGAVGVLVMGTVIGLTQTDFGRERVRRLALGIANKSVHGTIAIGHLHGNLLSNITADSVSITDSTGAPFVRARSVSAHYSLRDLIHKRLDLKDVTADQPVVVLDQSKSGSWNFERIFPSSPSTPADTSHSGFGRFIRVRGLRIVNGRFVLYRPAPDKPDTASRMVLVAVPGGYDQVIEADRVNAFLPLVRVADPTTQERLAQVATLNADLALYTPPIARIEDLAAVVHLNADSLWFHDARVAMPASKISDATGRYSLKSGDLAVTAQAAPAALNDLRFGYPRLPTQGTVAAAVKVQWRGKAQDYTVKGLDLRTGPARASGQVGLHMGDSLALRETQVTFSGVDTRLIEQVVPAIHLKRQGIFAGRAGLDGSLHALRIDSDITFDDSRAGPSRLTAVGLAGLDSSSTGRVFRAQDLAVTLDNVQVDLARTFMPSLPVHGTISGDVHLDGSTATRVVADADLMHVDGAELSHLSATGSAEFAGHPAHHPWINLDATVDPVSLTEAGRFAPVAALYGIANGTAHVTGDLGDLTLHSRMVFAPPTTRPHPQLIPIEPKLDTVGMVDTAAKQEKGEKGERGTTLAQAMANGDIAPEALSTGVLGPTGKSQPKSHYSLYPGRLGAKPTVAVAEQEPTMPDTAGLLTLDGHLDLASKEKSYDLHADAVLLDAHAISTKAPATTLTAVAALKGRGTALATMNATMSANVAASIVDSVDIDTLSVSASVADGMLHVDTAHIRLPAARADLAGTLGLVAAHEGRLTYNLTIDSLSSLGRLFPKDTGVMHPDRGRLATAYKRLRGDTAGTGLTTEEQLQLDTVAFRRDLLSGRVHAAGVVEGSIDRFDVRGRAAATDVIAMRNTFRRMRAEYAWLGAPSLTNPIVLGVQLDTVGIGTFALDSVDARLIYHKPAGSLVLVVRQRGVPETAGGPPTHDQEYSANVDFSLKLDERQLRFENLALTFDTVTWTSPPSPTPPGVVEWGEQGIAVHSFNLTNGVKGKIAVDATIPKAGPLTAHVDVEHLEVGELVTLIESRRKAHGDLTLLADVSGTAHSPRFTGNLTFADGSYDGLAVPDLRTRFTYDGRTLGGHTELATNIGSNPGRVFAKADGHIAIDLSTDHDSSSRVPDGAPVALDLDADSLPVDLLPEFVSTIQNVQGHAASKMSLSGTVGAPVAKGFMSLTDGSILVVPLNVRVTGMGGMIRVANDSLIVDSLVASSQGKMRVSGSADLTPGNAYPISLDVVAHGFRAINSKDFGWAVIDDSINIAGPLTALNLNGPDVRLVVNGSLRVTDGVFYAPDVGALTPQDLTDPVVYKVADTTDHDVKAVIPQPTSLLNRAFVIMDVDVDPQVWVRNKDANVEIYTDGSLTLRVQRGRNNRSQLVLDGVVATERGQYTFLSKRFQITKGAADFVGTSDLDPTVQATAAYPVSVPGREPVNIQINITGTALAPKVALTSDAQPPLSQSDLIAYLAFGSSTSSLLPQSSAGGGGASGGISGLPIGEAGTYVQQQLTSVAIGTFTQQLQGDVARALDADVFNITNSSDTPLELSQAGVTNYFASMRFEFGKYWTPTTYVALQASATNWNTSPPGALIQTRIANRTVIQATYTPYFLLQQPTLTPITLGNGVFPTKVFGLFLLRDWRF